MAQMRNILRNNPGSSLPQRRARTEDRRVVYRPSLRVAIQAGGTVVANPTGHMESSVGKYQ